MKKQITIIILLLSMTVQRVKAQEFYICTGTSTGIGVSTLREVQLPNCTSQLKATLTQIYGDITFHPSGKLYALSQSGQMYEININTGQATFVVNMNMRNGGAFANFNALTTSAQGIIYAAADNGKLTSYDPRTQSLTTVGTIRANNAVVVSAGDLTFYKGDLYIASVLNLVKIDLNNPSNSTIFMPFNVPNEIYGIVSFVECGQVSTYATTGDATGTVYKIDWTNRVLVKVCETQNIIFGGASRYEFKASNLGADTTRVTRFTCDKTKAGALPQRLLKNELGCDSLVFEILFYAKPDTTTSPIPVFTCDRSKVGTDTARLQSFIGCDSFVIRNQLIAPRLNENFPFFKTICKGDSFKLGQKQFYTEGSFPVVFKNVYGCDSTINLTIKFLRRDSIVLRPETCNNKVKDSVIILKNQVGCDSLIFIKPKLINNVNQLNNLPREVNLVIGDSIELKPQFNFSPSVISWTPSTSVNCSTCPTIFSRVRASTIVRLSAKDDKDCSVEQDVKFIVNPNRRVYIPNVFSPNNDKSNDVFTLYGDGNLQSILSLKIFDRWGETVFSGDNLTPNTEGWNGQFRGQPLTPDVFTFWAKLRFRDGDDVLYTGNITLVR